MADMGLRPEPRRIYLAYGSNLNVLQMSFRCPSARPIGTGVIRNHRLAFRGRRQMGVLTIEPWDGKHVPVVAWEVTPPDEMALDEYEGFPSFYDKETLTLPITDLDGNDTHDVEAFVYVMTGNRPLGFPTEDYLQTCREGYADFGFDPKLLDEAVRYTRTLQ